MSRRRGRERLPLNADINVVSLIDVMLMLMVIFMITAPLMQGGVDVALPSADVTPLESKTGMHVSVDKTGAIFVEKTRMTLNEFSGSFKALASGKEKDGVYLLADQSVPYSIVIKVIAIMNKAGVQNVSLVASPEETGRGGGSL